MQHLTKQHYLKLTVTISHRQYYYYITSAASKVHNVHDI